MISKAYHQVYHIRTEVFIRTLCASVPIFGRSDRCKGSVTNTTVPGAQAPNQLIYFNKSLVQGGRDVRSSSWRHSSTPTGWHVIRKWKCAPTRQTLPRGTQQHKRTSDILRAKRYLSCAPNDTDTGSQSQVLCATNTTVGIFLAIHGERCQYSHWAKVGGRLLEDITL